jgi:AcrR family transcriptional regulator
LATERRRGAALEDALLQAAWDELTSAGYANLTFEAVAARAHTSRMVLYRRWANRAQLVLAAVRRQVVPIAQDVPDSGDLREDILIVLRRVAARYQQFTPDVVHGLLAELPDVRLEVMPTMPEVLTTILARAAERGDVVLRKANPRILSLPTDLIRHDVLLTHDTVPEARLTEIVDDIFLPLVCE